MELKLYTFSKRKNSTKQPANTNLKATKSVYMKRETSVMSPTFLINNVDLSINYCKWDNNYYFVNDIVLNDEGMYELRCTMDVLATCKSTILSTSAEVMYASNSTKNIIDKRIPITAGIKVDETIQGFTDFPITENTMGTVILGLTGNGSFGPYAMENSNLISELLDGVDNWWNGTVIGESAGYFNVYKQLIYGGSASECLKSAISIPLLMGAGDISTGNPETITLGNYPCTKSDGVTPIRGYKITKPLIFENDDIDIPWQYAKTDWRRNAPYSQLFLYLPFVGLITLPTNDLINDDSLHIMYVFNVTSGDFSVLVRGNDTERIFSTSSGNIAMPTAYGSTGIDTNKLTSSVISGAGAVVGSLATLVATGGASAPMSALGIVGGLATAAGGTISALGGSGSGNGGLGGGSANGLDKVIHCYVVTRELTDTPANLSPIMGKPYMGKATINQLSGYVQTEGFSLSGAYLEPIITEVNSMMDAGVYIE